MASKSKIPFLTLSSLIPSIVLVSCSPIETPPQPSPNNSSLPTSSPTTPIPNNQQEIQQTKIYNSTYEKIDSKQYLFDFPKEYQQKTDTLFGMSKITQVLFSILFSKTLELSQQKLKLDEFIKELETYQKYLEEHKTFNQEQDDINKLFKIDSKSNESYLDSILSSSKEDSSDKSNDKQHSNQDLNGKLKNDVEFKIKTPDWWKLNEDYPNWLKNKYLKEYRSFSYLRVTNGDLKSKTEIEKEMILNQTAELFSASTLLFQPFSILKNLKKHLSLVILISKLNKVILKNLTNFETKEKVLETLEKEKDFDLDSLKDLLKYVLSEKTNSFLQTNEPNNEKNTINVFFTPPNIANDLNHSLFFNDILVLTDLIINPILSINKEKTKESNWFKTTLKKESEYFKTYLYNQQDYFSTIKFHQPKNFENNDFEKTIKDYLNLLKK